MGDSSRSTFGTVPNFIIWLSGVSGLLFGIITMFIIELRTGIETWTHLILVLCIIALFVVLCNNCAKKFVERIECKSPLGMMVWYLILAGFGVLLLIVLALAWFI